MDALIHGKICEVVPGDDIQQIFLFPPKRQISGDDILLGGVFSNIRGQVQDTGMEGSADNGTETAVFIRKIIIKGFNYDKSNKL